MNKRNEIEYIDFTNFNDYLKLSLKLVGLSDWVIDLKTSYKNLEELANVDYDIYEKKLIIQLSTRFKKLDETRKYNVLLHELVHARIGVFNEQRDKLLETLEEDLVNDLVRGFERKWSKDYQDVS